MSGYIVGIDPGAGSEYVGETIWVCQNGKWVIESVRIWEVKS